MESVNYVEGNFDGLACSDVKEPVITVVGYYNTIRYGWIPKFKLVVPKGARVVKTVREWCNRGQIHTHIEFEVITADGKVWYFTLVMTDDPADLDFIYRGRDKPCYDRRPIQWIEEVTYIPLYGGEENGEVS